MQPFLDLESRFAEFTKQPNMVVCSSGTAALHLALEAIGVKNRYVIVPDVTMIACARAVVLAGATPVFAPCDDRGLLNVNVLERYVRTCDCAAIMAVHMYGRRCLMNIIHEIAGDIPVVEDLAEAHCIPAHSATRASCWSFYANKIIHGEEGGAVAFSRSGDAEKAKQLRCLGFTPGHDYMHIPRGHNYRLSNAHAKLILDSLSNYSAEVNHRRAIEAIYNRVLKDVVSLQPARESPWVYDLRVPGMTYQEQASIVKQLNDVGIAARMCFKPMSIQPEFLDRSAKASKFSQEVFYLPLTLTTEEAEAAADVTRILIQQRGTV
jgi:perosamine synthetase